MFVFILICKERGKERERERERGRERGGEREGERERVFLFQAIVTI